MTLLGVFVPYGVFVVAGAAREMSWNPRQNRIQFLKKKSDFWAPLAALRKHKSDLNS